MILRSWCGGNIVLRDVEETPLYGACAHYLRRRASRSFAAPRLAFAGLLGFCLFPLALMPTAGGAQLELLTVAVGWLLPVPVLVFAICFGPWTPLGRALRLCAQPYRDPELWLIPAEPSEWGRVLWVLAMRRVRYALLGASALPVLSALVLLPIGVDFGLENWFRILVAFSTIVPAAYAVWSLAGIYTAAFITEALDDITISSPNRKPRLNMLAWLLGVLAARLLPGMVLGGFLTVLSSGYLLPAWPLVVTGMVIGTSVPWIGYGQVDALRDLDDASARYTGVLHPDFDGAPPR